MPWLQWWSILQPSTRREFGGNPSPGFGSTNAQNRENISSFTQDLRWSTLELNMRTLALILLSCLLCSCYAQKPYSSPPPGCPAMMLSKFQRKELNNRFGQIPKSIKNQTMKSTLADQLKYLQTRISVYQSMQEQTQRENSI